MPRSAKAQQSTSGIAPQTLILDNGAYTIKAGFASVGEQSDESQCRVIPNSITRSRDKKVYIAGQLDGCRDFGEMQFRRPIEKGYVTSWEGEKAIWEWCFQDESSGITCDPHSTNLVLTESPNCPPSLQTNTDQMVFEEFEFASYCRCIGASLNAYNDTRALFGDPPAPSNHGPISSECLLVIDSSYSHTTITPLLNGHPIHQAIRRMTVGGKFLTNYLKDLISLRHLHIIDETHLANQIKEDVSFVSSSFRQDIEKTWKGGIRDRRTLDPSIVVDYVLPDYTTIHRGYTRAHDATAMKTKNSALSQPGQPREEVIPLANERFVPPELLFHPSDIGLQEAGLPEVVMQSLEALPESLRPVMLANIMVVGGNSLIAGFMERLEKEIRETAPSQWMVRIKRADDPIKSTWLGGARMASHSDVLKSALVTRHEYQEHGAVRVAKKFAAGLGGPVAET